LQRIASNARKAAMEDELILLKSAIGRRTIGVSPIVLRNISVKGDVL
jgi:hypothetical protein